MADGKSKRTSSMKPKPGVIDLEATEIERGPIEAKAGSIEGGEQADAVPDEQPLDAADDPLAQEPPPQADDPNLFEAEPRSQLGALIAAGVAGAAIALSLFVILLASGFIPIGGGIGIGDPALGSRVADLETQLRKVTETPPPAPQPPPDDSAIRDEIESLSQQVAQLRASPPLAPAASDPELQARVTELAARVDTLAKTTEDRAGAAAFDQLAARVDELSAQTTAARAPDPAVQQAVAGAKSAAALAAVASLEGAVARGVPYAAALGAVRRQMPDAPFAALDAGAERGLPPTALLAERLIAKLEKAPTPASSATGFVDRLAEGARGLVRVRPVDGSVPDISANDPWSARNAVSIRLGQGDYAGALTDWDKLDTVAKEATKGEAEALKARLDADAALDTLRAAALGINAGTAP
jgi:hypothetical protein